MKEVRQTKFGLEGNCLSAVWASILEEPIENMPYELEVDYGKKWAEFFFKRGFYLIDIPSHWGLIPRGYHEIYGKSPRGDFMHALVGKDGQIVFDVHPDNTGLESIAGYCFLIPIGERLSLHLSRPLN